jgi:DNA-binding transcriptional regulator YiaG
MKKAGNKKKARPVGSERACRGCGKTIKEMRASAPFGLVGRWSVMVEDAIHMRCSQGCEYHGAVGFERIEGILRAVAAAVIAKPSRLAPEEIRFLQGRLDLEAQALARRLGVTAGTLSRWENGHEPIGKTPEALLRTLVALHERDHAAFDPAVLEHIDFKDGAPVRLTLRQGASGRWQRVAA